MHCPFCQHDDTRVVDSRLTDTGKAVRRRRECQHCGTRFSTLESAEIDFPMVVKQNGTRESFHENKLRTGILRALEKRPITAPQIDQIIRELLQTLRLHPHREIPSRAIGQMVMEKLKALDHVAYIRFASVYLSFQDLQAYQNVIDELTARQS
ncbi:MAG: transcriptional regulator NrdR [Cardiobacteriaceae bacterium]|nr:transcriptional regulator NrdR [Cardiobacteriaceae bacterium]